MNSVHTNSPDRQRNPRGEGDRLREALLEAATELLAEKETPDEVSVRAITARAGVSPTALYLHFDGRESLIHAVNEASFAELGNELRAAETEAGDDPRAQLTAMCHAYLRFANKHAGQYAVLFVRRFGDCDAEDSEVSPIGLDIFGVLVEAVTRAGAAAENATDDAVLIWMALHGRASVTTAMPGFPFPEESRFVDRLVDRILGPSR